MKKTNKIENNNMNKLSLITRIVIVLLLVSVTLYLLFIVIDSKNKVVSKSENFKAQMQIVEVAKEVGTNAVLIGKGELTQDSLSQAVNKFSQDSDSTVTKNIKGTVYDDRISVEGLVELGNKKYLCESVLINGEGYYKNKCVEERN